MSSVLVATLVSDPSKAPLSEATVERAAQALNGIERWRWLDEGVAADLVFTGDLKARCAALEEIAAARGLPLGDTLAVGDGANDLPMLRAAGLGIAYRAKPKVAAAADARVERADLSALLYAQGYARKDFVEG
jgi:hypothetical protein